MYEQAKKDGIFNFGGGYTLDMSKYPDFESFFRDYVAFYGKVNTSRSSTTKNNGIVPELRGASSFAGNTSGMLVVIDGFVQGDFPADYPMNNVSSIEVIKDPTECIKWGPRGAGGVILITTNQAKAGELQISYSSNFYFSPRPDISAGKLQLASSADVLDYYKEAYDRKLTSYVSDDGGPMPIGLSPAQTILFSLSRGKITKEQFNSKWDSLGRLSNREQLRQLQQNTFSQNHSLVVSGGSKAYRFSIGGVYGHEHSGSIGTGSTRLGLNLKNDLSVLNGKLKARWVLDINSAKNKSGTADDGSNLDPYQLLWDEKGNYVYNYGTVTQEKNAEMMRLGYLESGTNLLEDARQNQNINKLFRLNSSLDLEWQLAESLRWATSFRYGRNNGSTTILQGASSSQTRQLINDYGIPVRNNPDNQSEVTGIDFYVPPGAIFKKSASDGNEYNLRSGMVFDHTFNGLHRIRASIDGGLSDQHNQTTPGVSIYGYNPNTRRGLPLLAAPSGSDILQNYNGTSIDLGSLVLPGMESLSNLRNISINGDVSYLYDQRYSLRAVYAAVFIPNYGESPPYSTTSRRFAEAGWQINKEHFFHLPWISTLKFGLKAGELQVARLSAGQVDAIRVFQPLWNNSSITVNGYNQSQQNGQKNRDLGAQLDFGLSRDNLLLKLAYTHNSIDPKTSWNVRLDYDIAREPYFRIPWISSLHADVTYQNLSPYQLQEIVMGANSLSSGGTFSMPGNSNLSLLPPEVLNKEAHLLIGMAENRITLDLRYYRRTIAGLSNGNLPTDPSTGLNARLNYSKILNKGLEVVLKAGILKRNNFEWVVTLNGAYNVNQAIDVPPVNFSLSSNYLTAPRNGYSIDNLWSYRWAGLDTLGNPQVYNKDMQKVPEPDAGSMVYSGRTKAPWSGALIQEWRYMSFFASTRLMFNLGHVMRRYIPVLGSGLDRNIQIRDRWRKPGDEAFTDIAGIAPDNNTRAQVIQGSSNAVLPADNIRLREIQFGYEVPAKVLGRRLIKALTFSVQMENVALWTRNKMHIDPEVVSTTGLAGISLPRRYILSINMSF